jgi:hemoglobin
MSDVADLGGDPACWAHVFDDGRERPDIRDVDDIEHLVRAFYRRAAMDDVLGPVFETAAVDWPSHIETLTAFWAWQLLLHRGYEGNPLRAHERLQATTPFTEEHFERWLELFGDTVDDLFAGPTAEIAKVRAAKMAAALRRILRSDHV